VREQQAPHAEQPAYVGGQLIVKVKASALASTVDLLPASLPEAVFAAIPSLDKLNQHYSVMDVGLALELGRVMGTGAIDPTAAQYGLDRVFVLYVPADTDIWQMAAAYADDAAVEYAEPNMLLTLREPPASPVEPAASVADAHFPNDPYFAQQDNLYNTGQGNGVVGADVNALLAWELQTGSADVVVAVVDTGVAAHHPDLQGKLLSAIDYDFLDNDANPQDTYDHGTRVAGIIAANSNNGVGIAGVCWFCRLLPLRVGTSVIHLASLEVAEAIFYAAALKVDVINMSLGGQCSNLWIDVVNYAYARDVVMVAAAGNVVEFVVYPARFQRVIAVSAVNNRDLFSLFSSFGPELDISAPGEEVLVTDAKGSISRGTGSSYAAAHTSGIVGLLRSTNPGLTNSQIAQILRASAVDLGPAGFDPLYGYGRVNARAALELAANPPAPTAPPPQEECSCILSLLGGTQAAGALAPSVETPAAVDTLHRIRDEVLAGTPLGQEITRLYYRHSSQVAHLVFANEEVRATLKATLATSLPYALAALEGSDEVLLDASAVKEANSLIAQLAASANPELRDDLYTMWEMLDLDAYVGQPVTAIIEHLGRLPQQPASGDLFLPFVTVD
jgi:subtilisin family serine protease